MKPRGKDERRGTYERQFARIALMYAVSRSIDICVALSNVEMLKPVIKILNVVFGLTS